jgi:amidase
MSFQLPTIDELATIAARYHLHATHEELVWYRQLMADDMQPSYNHIDQLVEPTLPVTYPRTPGYRPQPHENPLGAWYWRTEVRGASSGPLVGKTVVLKDNICLAGVPMMNGSLLFDGYIPDIDATVVTRVLDAGGTIVGKAVCENLCYSGGSHTAETGPVRNPHNPEYSAGGSSSGCAVLVSTGEVDLAIGCDQGGSIRGPSSWCGIIGLKPSYGLVPYTGIYPLERTLDHVGPMGRTVADVALLLEVLAGPDGLDSRQTNEIQPFPYTQALTGDITGLRLAIVKEGFDWPNLSKREIDECVLSAAQQFTELGAQVDTISIPWHYHAVHTWILLTIEGMSTMIANNTTGTNWKGYYHRSMQEHFGRGRTIHAQDLPLSLKPVLLLGTYLQERYFGSYYAKAQNLSRQARAAYDAALRDYDLLIMPTTPYNATRIPPYDASREEYQQLTTGMSVNMGPFNMTGHPAISVPCGTVNGLPVGMMLVGRYGDDATVLRAADVFTQNVG